MTGATKTLTVCTLVALVLASLYTVGLGSNGWLWSGWTALALATAASALLPRR
jgi:hypothetical protein